MSRNFNLRVKENVGVEVLLEYGFKPRYDVDTGKVIEYYRSFKIPNGNDKHFTFKVCAEKHHYWFKQFFYDAWMSGVDWCDLTAKECLEIVFKLIKDDVIEISNGY